MDWKEEAIKTLRDSLYPTFHIMDNLYLQRKSEVLLCF